MPAPGLDRLSAEVMEYTVQPEFTDIRRRAGRRRARRRLLAAAAAVGLLAGGALGWAAGNPGRVPEASPASPVPSGLVPYPDGPVSFADAGDATHLYAVLSNCVLCPVRLVGSDDGGRTWTVRHTVHSGGPVADVVVRGPQTLVMPPDLVSTDGGRTWTSLVTAASPASRVPDGGWLACGDPTRQGPVAVLSGPDPCDLRVVDPAARTIRPLAASTGIQPVGVAAVPAAAGLWVMGLDHDGRAAVSVSHDGGATWSVSSFRSKLSLAGAGIKQGSSYTVELSTHDGRTVDVVTTELDRSYGYRSTDSGVTWHARYGGTPLPMFSGPSVTLPDGTQVIQVWGTGNKVEPFTSADGVTGLGMLERPGWPKTGTGVRPGVTGLYTANDRRTLYWSTDGVHWHSATPQA